jgi:hypothetical protein
LKFLFIFSDSITGDIGQHVFPQILDMLLELFQGICPAAEPAAQLDVFSGPVEEKLAIAFGADGGFYIIHNGLATVSS